MKILNIFTALCVLAIHATPAHALDLRSIVYESELLELCYYANKLNATATNPHLVPKVKSKLMRKAAAEMAKCRDEVKALYPVTSEAFATV